MEAVFRIAVLAAGFGEGDGEIADHGVREVLGH